MTKVPQRFDFSFLNDEEARKILQVLERNEELQRAEKERIRKLQKTKRDIRWLQGVTGEWFEEIQRKKFCNETDVSQMLKKPLTYRLSRGITKNDAVELQTSSSKNLANQKNPPSFSSRLSLRSSLASLFSFGKSRKESLKLPKLGQKGCDGLAETTVPVRETVGQAKIYSSPLENQPVDSAIVPKPASMREESGMSPWDASLLEKEFFRVLDDLDSKLAQEQATVSMNTRPPFNYKSRTQFSHFYSHGNNPGNIRGRHKNRYNETSNMSIYDVLRPGAPRESFNIFSPRTRTIYDMYRTREPRAFQEDNVQKNTFGSSSLCFDIGQRLATPATGHFTARSLHFPATTQNKTGFLPQSHQQRPKRTPLSSIIWNRSDPSRDDRNQEEFLRAPSPMEMDPADQYMYPTCFQENRRYEFYHSQSIYQSVDLNAPMNNRISPDPFENSENMPFYHQDKPFSRSFFSNTFGQGREQRFRQNSFWAQQEDHSSWPDFYQNRKLFDSSDRDFEMISTDVNSVSAACSHSVPSQHWGSFSPGYGSNVSREQEEPCPWRFDFQTSTLESMEVSQGSGNHLVPHFSTSNICRMTESSCHVNSGGLESQQDSSSRKVHLNKEGYSLETAQPLASSFKTSFSQISDDKGNPQSSNFQNPTVTLQGIIPNKPVCCPSRIHTEILVTKGDSTDSPFLADSQPSTLVTEENNKKDLNDSILEKYKQLHRMDQANMTGETLQPVLQTGISNPLPNFQNPSSQDSAENSQFVFSASTTVSTKRSPRVLPRKDISQVYTSHRDKANELEKETSFSGNRKLGSETSSPFFQDVRTSSFPSPSQGCHQELTENNEDTSGIVKNNHWSTDATDNQNPQSPEKPVILDSEQEQRTMTDSIICSMSAASRNGSHSPLHLPPDTAQDSSPSNNSSLGALVIPSRVLSRKSLSGNVPSLGERQEEDKASTNQNNQFALSLVESKKSNNGVPVHHKTVDMKHHSHHPFRNTKGRGKIRRRMFYIENLSQPGSRSASTDDSSHLSEVNRAESEAPEPYTIYCTLPRKSPSFLINSITSENKVMAASFTNDPLPFQIKNHVEDPVRKYTSNKFSPSSPASDRECSKVVSDSDPAEPATAKTRTNTKITESASVRKGPFPVLLRRAVSCPSGEPYSSVGNDEREKCSASDTCVSSAMSPRPWERIINTLESDSSVRDSSLTKRYHHQKKCCQACTEKDGKIAASRAGLSSLPNEDPVSFSSEVSGKESGKTLHKYKTTSTFSVSGDDDNIKCLEVVSIYYTLPRKHSKKCCNLFEKYMQSTDSITESPELGTETFPNAEQNDQLNYSTQEQSGTSSSEDHKMLVNSSQNSTSPSQITENVTVLQLPNNESSGHTSQEMAFVEADISLSKGESETRDIFPDHFIKAHLSDSLGRKKKGKKLQRDTLHTSLMLQDKEFTEEKLEKCQQSIKSGNSYPSTLLVHSEDNPDNSQTVRSSGENARSGTTVTPIGSGKCPQKEISTNIALEENSNGLQAREVKGKIGTNCLQMTDKALSDSESHVSVVTLALHKLQFDEETYSDESDTGSVQSEPKELPKRSQKIHVTENRKAKGAIQRLAWDQSLLPAGNEENKASFDGLEKAKNRSLVKHKLAAISKANRKFPVKDISPRRHVATIFTESRSRSGVASLAPSTLESNPLTPEPSPMSAESRDESSRLSNDEVDVEKFETPLQVTVVSNREPSTHLSDKKSNIISQPHLNEFKNISELLPENENSVDATVTQALEQQSGTLAKPMFLSLREAEFSDPQKRLSPPCPLEPVCKSPTVSIPLANCQQQQRSTSPREWELEPHLHRSKSLKSISVHGNKLQQSHPPKVRERHFSESTSIDNALSQLTLGNEFSVNNGYNRRFKSFSELPSYDENDNWALYSDRTRTVPKSATSISRPIDYGIFGKEQQLAFLENVKKSLTQGRLWKPSFLKNPGFLKDDIINPPKPSESLSSNSGSDMPNNGLFPPLPLNIYEEDPMDSDYDTDTTTDDEYYLDENDKESEL